MFKHPPHRVIERSKYRAQKKTETFLYDHPQQPTDVVTGCAQHGVNPVTGFTLQMAPTHSVIMLQMPDHGLNRLATLQQSQFRFVQSPLLAAMIDLNARIIVIDAVIPKVDIHRAWSDSAVLKQDRCLFQLLGKRVPIKRISAERSRTDNQVTLHAGRNAHLRTDLVGRTRFAHIDTGHFRGVPAVNQEYSVHRCLRRLGKH
jgi:hypothetical protein